MENVLHENSVPLSDAAADAQPEAAASAPGRGRAALPWGNYARLLLLAGVFALVAVMTWQPGTMRLSMLMNMGTPPPGASLDWSPAPAPPAPVLTVRRIQPPAEWRPGPVAERGSPAARPGAQDAAPSGGGGLAEREWLRTSSASWAWRDDLADDGLRRGRDLASALPPQKPESTFRAAAGGAAWPEGAGAAQAQPASIPSASGLTPPSLPAPAVSGAVAAPAGDSSRTPPAIGLEPAPEQEAALRALRPLDAMTPAAATAAVNPPSSPQAPVDWLNREITGPVPGAYLTVYPKLKFIGLCVPEQGYIRKYNQVGVPADAVAPKTSAQDGRTPYGRYYIADRHRDADGPRLYLSWPSPDDARRAGLDAARQAEVEAAWQRMDLPPQDTAAGGGVGLTGLRNWVEVTEGGFTLETPAMEEIFTALPDGAWVFIQP